MATGKLVSVSGCYMTSEVERFLKSFRRQGENGQAARPISTSQLHTLLRFHLWPINLVVYEGPLGTYVREIYSWGRLPA